jgi:hypothetical protein
MQAFVGNILDRCITDAGYRAHNAPPDHKFKVYTTGQKRRVTPQIKREFKRRAAIESRPAKIGQKPSSSRTTKYPRAIIHLSRIASFAPPTAFCTLPLT